jgi:hypothetical protein
VPQWIATIEAAGACRYDSAHPRLRQHDLRHSRKWSAARAMPMPTIQLLESGWDS